MTIEKCRAILASLIQEDGGLYNLRHYTLPKEDQDLLEKWGIQPLGGIIECHFDYMIKVARKLEQLSSQIEK